MNLYITGFWFLCSFEGWQIVNNLYFDDVIQIGRLYLEYIFYEFESEPVLFTCIDEQKKYIYVFVVKFVMVKNGLLLVAVSAH